MYSNEVEIDMKTVAIIQARMGSQRLPGKILKVIGSLPLYQIVHNRVAASELVDDVVFATTNGEQDDAFCNELSRKGIPFYRGSELDVLTRFKKAAEIFDASIIVRITCDDPFKDPHVIDQCLLQMRNKNAEFSSNVIEKTYAEGLDVECMSRHLLNIMSENAKLDYQREHVTPYFYEHKNLYTHCSVTDDVDLSEYRLTLDDPIDLELMTDLYRACNFDYDVSYELIKQLIQVDHFREKLVGRVQPYAGLLGSKEVQK